MVMIDRLTVLDLSRWWSRGPWLMTKFMTTTTTTTMMMMMVPRVYIKQKHRHQRYMCKCWRVVPRRMVDEEIVLQLKGSLMMIDMSWEEVLVDNGSCALYSSWLRAIEFDCVKREFLFLLWKSIFTDDAVLTFMELLWLDWVSMPRVLTWFQFKQERLNAFLWPFGKLIFGKIIGLRHSKWT